MYQLTVNLIQLIYYNEWLPAHYFFFIIIICYLKKYKFTNLSPGNLKFLYITGL